MEKFTRWIVAKTIKDYPDIDVLKVRTRYGCLEGGVSIVFNIVIFVIKIIAGFSLMSIALIADAIHTLSDSATSVVVIIGFKMANKPSDKEHPFGHGRMESVTALIISVLLFIVGVEVLKKSIYNIVHPQATTASIGVIILVVGTLVIKELMSRFSYQLGEIIDSQTLKADAMHHRSDAISTILVVIALIAGRFGIGYIDGVMGIGVALIISYSGYSIAKKAIDPLLGQAPSKETIKEIESIARGHQDVLGVHDIIFHKYGQTSIISLHIEVSDKEAAFKLHAISEEVEAAIVQKTRGTVIVHVDPVNKEHPQYEAIAQIIKDIIGQEPRVSSFHELRIVGQDIHKCNVVFDIALEKDADEQETYDIKYSIERKIRIKFPQMKIFIKAEPKYAYDA